VTKYLWSHSKIMSVDYTQAPLLVVTVKGRRDKISAQLSAEILSRRPITVTTSRYVRVFVFFSSC